MGLNIVEGTIFKGKADALVIPAFPEPFFGCGLDLKAYELAGINPLLEERRKYGRVDFGEAIATDAYGLSRYYKYIIHVVTPPCMCFSDEERNYLSRCYESVIDCALSKGCKTISVPLLGSGVMKWPRDIAMEIAKNTLEEKLKECGNKAPEVTLFILKEKSYDEQFVQALNTEIFDKPQMVISEDEISVMIMDSYFEAGKCLQLVQEQTLRNKAREDIIDKCRAKKDTYSDLLIEYEMREDIGPSQLEKRSGINKGNIARLEKGEIKRPGRDTLVALGIGLHLSYEEMVGFIYAGIKEGDFPKGPREQVVYNRIINKDYNLLKININLETHGLDKYGQLRLFKEIDSRNVDDLSK